MNTLTDEQLARFATLRAEQIVGYFKHRAKGIDPVHAFQYAKARDDGYPEFFRKIGYGSVATGQVDEFTVRIEVEYDEDARLGDDDVTGTFSDVRDELSLKNDLSSNWNSNGDDYEWYQPSNYDREYVLTGQETPKGMSKGVAQDWIAERVRQAMHDDRYRTYYGVTVEVEDADGNGGSNSLWGIDMLDDGDDSYFRDVAAECMSEAIYEARERQATKRRLENEAPEAPEHPVTLWKAHVSNDETRLGYRDWVAERRAAADDS